MLLYLLKNLFTKNIMKYQRERKPQKKRKISAFNAFQMDWWAKNKTNGIYKIISIIFILVLVFKYLYVI